jgi:predicted Zn finger-like uncharacterized protein
MKIVCDNCATKYSIADEKVRGKVFKIRCKKCSHIIVVRGGADGSVEASSSRDAAPADGGFPGGSGGGEEQQTIAARGAPGSGGETSADAVWHLVIDREQVGPLSPSEVRAKFAGGEVDAETYAWREGFGDWLRLGSIEDFRDLGGDAPATPDAGATRRTDAADLFAGAGGNDEASDAPSGDLFGGAAPAPAYSSAPAPSNEDVFGGGGGGGALFSAPSAAPAPSRQSRTSSPSFSASSAAAESAPSSGHGNGNVVDVRPMTGQRNENSVLFSLNNLQALATGGASGGKSAQSGGSENRPGFANSQTEGSGLIDIRAMAASTLAASPSTGGIGSGPGELPGLGAAPVFSPMAAPILMPSAPSGPPQWMWAILGVGVLAVLGIVVVGALLLTRKPTAEPTTIAQAPVAAAPGAAAPVATGVAAKPTAAAPAATAPAVAAATPAAATPAAEKHAKAPKGEKPVKVAKNEPAAAKAAAEPAPAAAAPVAAAPAAKHSGKRDELDDLLNNASPGETPKQHKAAAAAAHEDSGGGASDESLPDTLDKGQIVSGMSKVKGRVQGCFDQFKVPGTANVAITISNSGRVSAANVTGQFAGTPTGECVAKAVKTAGFSRFKGSPMSFVYPYLLR